MQKIKSIRQSIQEIWAFKVWVKKGTTISALLNWSEDSTREIASKRIVSIINRS